MEMTLSNCIIYGTNDDVENAAAKSDNLNLLDEYGYPPLVETCIADDFEKAQILIKYKADPNLKDITGRTALHWAAENNNYAICELLLENGAHTNIPNIASEPPLVKPLLRNHEKIVELLLEYDADPVFARDYINTKLLGHRFELIGSADIATPKDTFSEVDYEGFYFEFSLDVIQHSLNEYANNFAARNLRHLFYQLYIIQGAIVNAAKMSRFDHYLIDINQHRKNIDPLFDAPTLVLPISQEAHALTIIKHQNLLAIVDRAEHDAQNDAIPIYYINKPSRLTNDLLCELIYKKQKLDLYHKVLPQELGLQKVAELPINAQIIGNCSWANVEAVVPTLFFMLEMHRANDAQQIDALIADALELYHRWREWDKSRALQYAFTHFPTARPARKASLAAVLGGILFQRCSAKNPDDVERAKRIIPLLKTKGYEYILDSYHAMYSQQHKTKAGKNLEELLRIYALEEEL